jgi:hypothetical protein
MFDTLFDFGKFSGLSERVTNGRDLSSQKYFLKKDEIP